MVKHRELYWTKEGQYKVDKGNLEYSKKSIRIFLINLKKIFPVISLHDNTVLTSFDCDEEQGQAPIVPPVPRLIDLDEKNLGKIASAGGKSSAYKSSYSMYKQSDAKPITRSSTSTTSGTFLIKPSGVVEATGFKTHSSYDSTRRDGEQWQHSKSELSAAEIEELKRLHGPSFEHFSSFQGLHQPYQSAGASGSYQEKYFAKESKNIHGSPLSYHSGYIETPVRSSGYHQSYFAKESSSSSSSHTKPLTFQHSLIDTVPSGGQYQERFYTLESGNGALAKPLPIPVQHGSIIQKSEFHKEEKAIPIATVPIVSPPEQNYEFSRKETHRRVVSNNGVSSPVYPSPEIGAIVTGRQKQTEFTSGNLQLVDKPTFKSHYVGSIFTSSRSVKASTPEQCELVPHIDYRPSGDVLEVEKSVNKLSCLATLAEASVKEELRLVKQQNSELSRKFELLELEVKRLTEDCKCLEKVN